MNLNENNLDTLSKELGSGKKRIIIVGHVNPDGDALGSSLAWGGILESLGHDVTVVMPNKFPSFLDWIDGIDRVQIFKNDHDGAIAQKISEAEMIFCLDFNQLSRLEGMGDIIAANKSAYRVLVDHHLSPGSDFDLMFSHPESSSTSYLIYRIIESIYGREVITKPIGSAIYVGMMTDTGNFSFGNLSPRLFRAVAGLVEQGVDIPYINSSVYNSYSEERVRLLGYVLDRKMKTFGVNDLNISYISLTEDEMRRFRFQVGDSEGFVNYPLTIKKVSMSAMFLQTKHFIRISLRSRGDVDVNLFARRYFNGGGHKNAAGGKSFVSMAETIALFEKSVKEYFA